MYNLFFGIAYGHLGSIRMKNEIFSKNKQKRENKNNHKVFLMFIISDTITNALLQPIKLSRFLQGNTKTGMVTTHSSFMNGHI